MNDFNVTVALLGGVILVLGLASQWLSASPFPPTLLALFIGIGIGPEVLGLVNLDQLGSKADLLERAGAWLSASGW